MSEELEKIGELDDGLYKLFEFRPRKGDIKKLEIIKATIDCLAQEGLAELSYEAIAKRVGTRRAHIAYHFSDKRDIYLAAVKYIVATSQQIIIDHIGNGPHFGKDTLSHYVEAYFLWAKKHPEQLSVMLLFYYLCNIHSQYRELHEQIREAGKERLVYILTQKLGKKLSALEISQLGKYIQYLITGSMIDATTMKTLTLDQAQENVTKLVSSLVKRK